MRVMAIIGLVLGLTLSGAAAQTRDPLPLVKSFYAKNFDQDKMPLAPRLRTLFEQATAVSKKRDEPVAGLDFSWTTGAQDADEGWEKSLRYALLKADERRAVVQVKFRLFKNDKPQELHYALERQGERWLVADIIYVDQNRETLSNLLTRGAEGRD